MLALVIPTVEESASLPSLLNRVREALESTGTPFEILVVDDDSRDCTAQLVGAIAAEDPRVRLLVRKGERGLSGAILHGWQNTQAEILGVIDADLQHPPELLPQLLAAVLNGCHLAIGSRYTQGGSPGPWNPLRRWISAVAVAMTWPLQPRGMRVKDPMSGFFLVCAHASTTWRSNPPGSSCCWRSSCGHESGPCGRFPWSLASGAPEPARRPRTWRGTMECCWQSCTGLERETCE